MKKLTYEEKRAIADGLAGTAMGDHDVMETLDADDDEFLAFCVEFGLHACDACGWWEYEKDMIVASNGVDLLCGECTDREPTGELSNEQD